MLAAENNILSEYKDQLKRIKDLLQDNPDYIDVLESPAIPLSERIELVDKAFSEGYHEYIVSFIKLLCENRHVKKLCSCKVGAKLYCCYSILCGTAYKSSTRKA